MLDERLEAAAHIFASIAKTCGYRFAEIGCVDGSVSFFVLEEADGTEHVIELIGGDFYEMEAAK